MTGYTDTLALLASVGESKLTALVARVEAGEVTTDQFAALAVAELVRLSARGVALADVALAAVLSVQRGRAVAPLGLGLPDDTHGRLSVAVGAVVAAGVTVEAARVLGRAEPLAAAQDAYGQGMRDHGVEAWTRVLNSGACELCQDLAGDVLPASADMYHHKGCGCSQQPITERN